MTFFREQGSIALAMMLQTNHCLLYLSVSFTHLKRSTDSVVLIGARNLPFPSWIDLKVAEKWTVLMQAIHLFPLALCLCSCPTCARRKGAFFAARMCAQAFVFHFMYCSGLQRDGPAQCFIIKQGTAPLWRSNEWLLQPRRALVGFVCKTLHRRLLARGSGNSGSHWSLGRMKAED